MDVDLELAGQLRSVIVPLARQLRQQAGGHLTATQSSVLGSVARHGPINISELARRERLSLAMISKIVAALEHAGLVSRRAEPADGRVRLIELSAHGRAWIHESRERRDRWLAERLGGLDPHSRATVAAAVAVLLDLSEESS